MATFDKREEAYENRFAHDEELQFKALARAHKLMGLWAAEKMGKSGAAADEYANQLVASGIVAHATAVVVERVQKDFVKAGVTQSEHQIGRHFEEFHAQAVEALKNA